MDTHTHTYMLVCVSVSCRCYEQINSWVWIVDFYDELLFEKYVCMYPSHAHKNICIHVCMYLYLVVCVCVHTQNAEL